MSRRRIAVVSAGLSQPSSTRLLADQLSAATVRELQRRGLGADVEVVELRAHAHDLMNNMLTGYPSGDLEKAITTVTTADGVIAVTPIFTASYSGLFKSFFDVLDNTALVDKPLVMGATGGTARHSLALEHALRPLFGYLRARVMPTAVFAASEDFGGNGGGGALGQRVQRAGSELAAMLELAEPATVVDPFDVPTPFEHLLSGS